MGIGITMKLLDHIAPETKCVILFSDHIQAYQICYYLNDRDTYISPYLLEIGPRLLNVDLSGETDYEIYTAANIGNDVNGESVRVFIDQSGTAILKEYVLDLTKHERIMKHLRVKNT